MTLSIAAFQIQVVSGFKDKNIQQSLDVFVFRIFLTGHAWFSGVSGNIKLVNAYDRQSQKFFLLPEPGLDVQADGAINFAFTIPKPETLDLINGHLQTKTHQGAGLYYPVTSIIKDKY